MTQGTLRRIVTWIILIGHCSSAFFGFLFIGNFDEAVGVALCLLPVTSTLVMFIIQFQRDNFFGSLTDTKTVSPDASFTTLFLSIVLVIALNLTIYGYYVGRIGSIDSLQKSINIIDSGVVVYLLILLRQLFERSA